MGHTRGSLGTELLSDPCRLDEPVVVAIGKGRILGPSKAVDVRMQTCAAAGYGILHTDPVLPGEAVTALVEDPRIEPPI